MQLVHPQDNLLRFITEYGITASLKEKLVDRWRLQVRTKCSSRWMQRRGKVLRGAAAGGKRCGRLQRKVVVDDDGRGISDIVGLSEPAAECMGGQNHEDETDEGADH